jgi:uncharacterized protein with GYD domain
MAVYVLLSNLTDEGRKTLKERPERLKEVNQEIEKMGAQVVAQYAVLGSRDFINIVEAPSNDVIARISVELGMRGTVRLTTLPALTIEAFAQLIKGGRSELVAPPSLVTSPPAAESRTLAAASRV